MRSVLCFHLSLRSAAAIRRGRRTAHPSLFPRHKHRVSPGVALCPPRFLLLGQFPTAVRGRGGGGRRCGSCRASPRAVAQRAVCVARARPQEGLSAVPGPGGALGVPARCPHRRAGGSAFVLLRAPRSRACGHRTVPRSLRLLPPSGRLRAGPGEAARGTSPHCDGGDVRAVAASSSRSPSPCCSVPCTPRARSRPFVLPALHAVPGRSRQSAAVPQPRGSGGAVGAGGDAQLSSQRWVSPRQRRAEVRTEQAEPGREQNCACHSRVVLFLDSKPPCGEEKGVSETAHAGAQPVPQPQPWGPPGGADGEEAERGRGEELWGEAPGSGLSSRCWGGSGMWCGSVCEALHEGWCKDERFPAGPGAAMGCRVWSTGAHCTAVPRAGLRPRGRITALKAGKDPWGHRSNPSPPPRPQVPHPRGFERPQGWGLPSALGSCAALAALWS